MQETNLTVLRRWKTERQELQRKGLHVKECTSRDWSKELEGCQGIFTCSRMHIRAGWTGIDAESLRGDQKCPIGRIPCWMLVSRACRRLHCLHMAWLGGLTECGSRNDTCHELLMTNNVHDHVASTTEERGIELVDLQAAREQHDKMTYLLSKRNDPWRC